MPRHSVAIKRVKKSAGKIDLKSFFDPNAEICAKKLACCVQHLRTCNRVLSILVTTDAIVNNADEIKKMSALLAELADMVPHSIITHGCTDENKEDCIRLWTTLRKKEEMKNIVAISENMSENIGFINSGNYKALLNSLLFEWCPFAPLANIDIRQSLQSARDMEMAQLHEIDSVDQMDPKTAKETLAQMQDMGMRSAKIIMTVLKHMLSATTEIAELHK